MNSVLQNIAISTIAYDGFSLEQSFASIAGLGFKKVEVALIDGTSSNFSEESFQDAAQYRKMAEQYKLSCVSLACHTDLGRLDADDFLLRRLNFAYEIGASRIITYTTDKEIFADFLQKIGRSLNFAKKNSIKILVENPSDGRSHIIGGAQDIPDFLQIVDSKVFGCNYDAGNFITHYPEKELLSDTIDAVSLCDHMHVKDVQIIDGNIYFCPIGEGVCNYRKILKHVFAHRPDLPMALEIPLRVFKDAQGHAHFMEKLPELQTIENTLRSSIAFIQEFV